MLRTVKQTKGTKAVEFIGADLKSSELKEHKVMIEGIIKDHIKQEIDQDQGIMIGVGIEEETHIERIEDEMDKMH